MMSVFTSSRPRPSNHQMEQPLGIVPFFSCRAIYRVPPNIDIGDAIIQIDPLHSLALEVDEASLRWICKRHRFPFEVVFILTRFQRAHDPPEGYTACNQYICMDGCVTPFKLLYSVSSSMHEACPNPITPKQLCFSIQLVHDLLLPFEQSASCRRDRLFLWL